MEGDGILQLLAELAVGVLGFSGVVAVLGRRGAGEWSPVDRLRFFFMVRMTALVLLLGVLPFPFYSAGFSSEAIWGWCSGAGAILILIIGLATRAEGIPKGMMTDPGTSRLALAYVGSALFVALIVFAVNATGIVLERSFTPYLVAVLLTFGVPIVFFIRLLHSAIGPRSSA